MSITELSLTEIAAKIQSRELSPVEVTEASLARIAETEPVVTAFAEVTEEVALEQARQAEGEIAAGRYRGPLHGIPYAAKELYNTAGIATTSSSDVRKGFVPDADSVAVARLREAGMILVGKTETHEFAYGALTPRSSNPWAPARTPGGSSGGSGAAVGAGGVLVALGSDTGGSIRIPAALCGTVGLKPTFGRASRTGVASLSWSLDHVGPLTRNVIDSALVMDAMSGYDRRDPGSSPVEPDAMADQASAGITGLKVGVPTNYFTDQLEDSVKAAYSETLALLCNLGAELVEVEIPYADRIDSTEWGIMMPEASAYHMKAMRETPELYTDEVRTFNEIGEMVRAVDYINALRMRELMQHAWREMYEGVDVVAAPTVPARAVLQEDPTVIYPGGTEVTGTIIYTGFTSPANLTGMPSLQIPNGFADGLPTGVQFMGRPFDERTLIGVGMAVESNSDHVGKIAAVPVAQSV